MGIEENKKVALKFLENHSIGNYDAAMALMAEDVEYWILGKPDKFPAAGSHTKTELIEILKLVNEKLPKGLTMTIKGITAEGDRVAVEAESYGETANGKIYSNQYHLLFEVRDGKVKVLHEYFDTMHAMEILMD